MGETYLTSSQAWIILVSENMHHCVERDLLSMILLVWVFPWGVILIWSLWIA